MEMGHNGEGDSSGDESIEMGHNGDGDITTTRMILTQAGHHNGDEFRSCMAGGEQASCSSPAQPAR